MPAEELDPASAFVENDNCTVLGRRFCSASTTCTTCRRRVHTCYQTRAYLFAVPGMEGNFTSRNETYFEPFPCPDQLNSDANEDGKSYCAVDGIWWDDIDRAEPQFPQISLIASDVSLSHVPPPFAVGDSYPCYVPAEGVGLLPP
uniref:Uncharacterized protein n=1 Tax=Odontella aurita TaxID=265563 RepID=A0A7S4K665_9STRA|mmetsp:Transcript_62611/g.185120  ORF Transcript_62611/g.185120 Transcript_62611/m.185120 type:complete len:145 (+) Transcript_62611:272-706(+)